MTYRNKLRLRRFLIILAIVLLALLIVGSSVFPIWAAMWSIPRTGPTSPSILAPPSAPEAEQAAAPVESPGAGHRQFIREQSILGGRRFNSPPGQRD